MQNRRFVVLVMLSLLLCCNAWAQIADSTCFSKPVKSSDFKATQLIAPGVLMASGAIIHFAAHDAIDVPINNQTSRWKGDGQACHLDDYLRFLPEGLHMGLGLVGVKSEHNFWDHTIEAVWAFSSYLAIGYSLKAIVDSPRPNGRDNRSFPSGHVGFAFTGAELVRMEYGWAWGAGAYAIATGVVALRLYNNEHWASDLLFGAGTGILCAHIGGWLLEPTKRLLGIKEQKVAFSATVDPISGAVCPTLAYRF